MKPVFLFAALIGVSFPVWAQNEPVVTAPIESRDLQFNLDNGGKGASVRDFRTFDLGTGGTKRLQWPGVRAILGDDADAITLRLGESARLLEKLGAPPVGVYNLGRFVNQRVSLVRDQPGGDGKTISGILRVVPDGVALETEAGTLLKPQGTWLLPNAASAPNREPEWLVNGAGVQKAEAIYTIPGLGFTARYESFLSSDRKRLELQGWLDISAPKGFDWRGANYTIGGVKFQFPDGAAPSGEKSSIAFVNQKFDVQNRLTFTNTDWNRAVGSESFPVGVRISFLTVQNPAIVLPAGSHILRLENENGPYSTRDWNGFSSYAKESLQLPLDSETDILRVSRTVNAKLLNPQTREVRVEWKVVGDASRSVLIQDALATYHPKFVEGPFSTNPVAGRVSFEAKGGQTIAYRYQVPA